MRALSVSAAAGPKVMRVGVLQGGRVVEERIIKQRMTVTIGSSESATFVIASPLVTKAFALFERRGPDYYLNVLPGMTGRIALASGIQDLPAGAARVKLGDDARGKVVVGDTTFLFQFVAPPPVQPRPQLPLGVKGGLATGNDWALTLIAAFSFLVHFGLVGAIYSDWADPIVGDRHDVAGLVDMISKITPPPVEVPEKSELSTLPAPVTSATPAPHDTPKSAPGTNVRATTPGTQGTPGPRTSSDRAAVLAARAESMQLEILAAREVGPAVQGALDRSNVPPVDLGAVAERNVGASRGNSDLRPVSGGPIKSTSNSGLTTLGNTRTDGTGTTSGTATNVGGPTAIAQIGAPTVSVAIPNADVVVAGLRNRFRSCYQTGLLSDSTMAGKVVISAKVGPNGEVTSADIASISGLSPSVGQCIAGVVKRATFNAPGGGGGSTLNIPVTFVQSK
ncbi:MAG: putative abductin-like protein [Labilithrix sp.]|nr:putative abductin-like protein [Labilithrix sp.]